MLVTNVSIFVTADHTIYTSRLSAARLVCESHANTAQYSMQKTTTKIAHSMRLNCRSSSIVVPASANSISRAFRMASLLLWVNVLAPLQIPITVPYSGELTLPKLRLRVAMPCNVPILLIRHEEAEEPNDA